MSGNLFQPRCFSPASIDYLRDNANTVVLFNCVLRDWMMQTNWPEEAFKQGENMDWINFIVHDIAITGAMKQLPKFLDECLECGIEIVQDFLSETLPIIKGKVFPDLLDGLVCSDKPEDPLIYNIV